MLFGQTFDMRMKYPSMHVSRPVDIVAQGSEKRKEEICQS